MKSNFAGVVCLILFSTFIISCANESSDDSSGGGSSTSYTVHVQAKATGEYNPNAESLRYSSKSRAQRKALASSTKYASASILSAAPDQLTVYVTKMRLTNSGSDSAGAIILSEPSGKPLTIRGRTIDMSEFFNTIKCIKEDGTTLSVECPCGLQADGKTPIAEVEFDDNKVGCPEVDEAAGEIPATAVASVTDKGPFDQLTVDYLYKAEVKGCVSGYMRDSGWVPSTDWDAGTNVSLETYCTRSGHDIVDAANGTSQTSSSYFSGTDTDDSETADILLGYSSGMNTDTATFSINYPLSEELTLDESSESTITMVIDSSRLLKFFKSDNYSPSSYTAGDGIYSSLSGSYFFMSRFDLLNFIFVGKVGDISGFTYETVGEWFSGTTDPSDPSAPASYTCTEDAGGDAVGECNRYVTGGLTVIYDTNDEPLLVSMSPNDNNVGLKASNTSENEIDASALTLRGGKYDLVLNGTGINTGTLYDLNISKTAVDAMVIGDSFSSFFAQDPNSDGANHVGTMTLTKDF